MLAVSSASSGIDAGRLIWILSSPLAVATTVHRRSFFPLTLQEREEGVGGREITLADVNDDINDLWSPMVDGVVGRRRNATINNMMNEATTEIGIGRNHMTIKMISREHR